jgi:5-methylcytosine-specific restriction protein A
MQNDLENLIKVFSSKYLLEAKGPYSATANARIITHDIPALLKANLQLGEEYKVYGSVGKGRWVEIPWFAILDKSITSSTERGYYVVILFDKNLENFYLSLALGWSQFETEYGRKEGLIKMRSVADHYARVLDSRPEGFEEGLLDLGAEKALGKGYEIGSVFSKKYLANTFSEKEFYFDLKKIISSYQELKTIVGDSILNIDVEDFENNSTVESFKKKVAAASFADSTDRAMAELIRLANNAPTQYRSILKKAIVRNKKFADVVKNRAGYVCELCGRRPFIQKNGKFYAEADHVVPLGGRTKGKDSPDNMRCLCAQCHAVVTHGREEEIKRLGAAET